MSSDWERGYDAGYRAAIGTARRDIGADLGKSTPSKRVATKKRTSPYHVAYGKAFKKVAPKYKLKSGKWAKDGFKRAAAAARKVAKRSV